MSRIIKCAGADCNNDATRKVGYPLSPEYPIREDSMVYVCYKHALEAVFNLGRGVTIVIKDISEEDQGGD